MYKGLLSAEGMQWSSRRLVLDTSPSIVAMKTLLVALLVLGAVACAHAGDVIDLDLDDFDHSQDGAAGQSVTGEYRWTSPEGDDFVVQYVADEKGFRILNSNAVPTDNDGVRADGAQGDLDGDSNERD